MPNSLPAFQRLSSQDQRALFDQAGQLLNLPARMVEKDAWVCLTLRHLFSLSGACEHLIFKGGTTLSKVWKVISRFSEDIDISLNREWIGHGGGQDPEAATGKERRRRLESLANACTEKLHDEILPALRKAISAESEAQADTLTIATDDPQTLLFAYPTVFPEHAGSYVRPVVRIEGGARSDAWPVSLRSLTPSYAEALPEIFPGAALTVPVLDITRTFWEKATILHAEAHRPVDKLTPSRFSRHYSDLAALAGHASAADALSSKELMERVVSHKQIFFPAAWASYATAIPGTFRLLPALERLRALEEDYHAMRAMFFRPPPSWEEIVETLRQLERRINTL